MIETDSINTILSPFTLASYILKIEALEHLHLPTYKGSAIRGSFGHTFRQIVCINKRDDCKDCALRQKCIYTYIFETLPVHDDPFLRNKQKAAHPYIIRPSLDERTDYKPGDELYFELVLIGKAMDYLPYFVYAFIQMGQRGLGKGRGRFVLKSVHSLGIKGEQSLMYLSGNDTLRDNTLYITCRDLLEKTLPPRQITMHFLTQLELKEKGKYPDISFGVLFRCLLRRIVTLAHLHCDIDCSSIDFSGISHAADEIETISTDMSWKYATRYSNRQKRIMPFSGFVGKIAFEGDFTPFWPFILLGEWVHAGKKTTFGFGHYKLIF